MQTRRKITIGLAAVAVTAPLALTLPAQATAWDPHVFVYGKVTCGLSAYGKVQGLWTWTAQEGGKWTAYPGTSYSESWYRDLKAVPTSGTTLHYTVKCSGMEHSGSFGVKRPAVGIYAARNIYW